MTPRIFFSLILISLPVGSHARLGETEGLSQQRYGQSKPELVGKSEKPVMEGALERVYEFEGWRIRAAFVEGFCVKIEYAHMPENGVPKPITDQEATAILAAEKGKFSWRENKVMSSPGGVGEVEKALKNILKLRNWVRSDQAKAELALGILLKIESRNADDLARKLAKKGPGGAAPAGGAKTVPKF